MFGLAHKVFKSLRTFKHQQASFKSKISRLFWKRRRSWACIPSKHQSAGMECCLPPEDPAFSWSQKLSHSTGLVPGHILWYFMLNIRSSEGHLAHGKLLGTGRPFPPNVTKSYRMKFPSLTCSLSSGMPCPPLGQMSHSCSYTAQPFCSQLFSVDLGLEHMESWNHPQAVAVTCQDRAMRMGRGERRE